MDFEKKRPKVPSIVTKSSIALPRQGSKRASSETRTRDPVTELDTTYLDWGWQATTKTLAERGKFLLERNILSDVQFILGTGPNQTAIPAHKFLLAAASKAFQSLFYGPSSVNPEKPVELKNVETQAFRNLLRYIYTDSTNEVKLEDALATLAAARKYGISGIMTPCVRSIKRETSGDNALTMLLKANQVGEKEMAEFCLSQIDNHSVQVLSSNQWVTDADGFILRQILVRDGLQIKETDLYLAVHRWAEHACERKGHDPTGINMRKELGDAIFLVRFPLMTADEVANGPAKAGLLTPDELNGLLLHWFSAFKPQTCFNHAPRAYTNEIAEIIVRRFGAVMPMKMRYKTGPENVIAFRVNRSVLLHGVGLYGNASRFSKYNVTMKVINAEDQHLVAYRESIFTADDTNCIYRVDFKQPVSIYGDRQYVLAVLLEGEQSWYGSNGKSMDIYGYGPDQLIFEFFDAEIAGTKRRSSIGYRTIKKQTTGGDVTNLYEGQIPELIFSRQ